MSVKLNTGREYPESIQVKRAGGNEGISRRKLNGTTTQAAPVVLETGKEFHFNLQYTIVREKKKAMMVLQRSKEVKKKEE